VPRRFDIVLCSPWIGPLLAPASGRATGGAEASTLILARALAARGNRVALACQRTGYPLPESFDGVDVIQYPRSPQVPLIRPLLTFAGLAWGLRRSTATVVQRAAGSTTLYVGLLAKLRRQRFIFGSVSVMDFEFERHAYNRWVAPLHRAGVRLASRIAVVTEQQAEMCRAAFGREPVLIPEPIEHAPLRSAEPSYFLWIGRLSPVKRPMIFAELARLVPETSFKMIAVPSGHYAERMGPELEAAVARTPNLELLAPRHRDQLEEVFAEAIAIVNTSEREGSPMSLLEGWARGVPALSLDFDPAGMIAREGLGEFGQGSIDRLADSVRAMWRSRCDQVALAVHCQEYAREHHSVAAVSEAWERLLRGEG